MNRFLDYIEKYKFAILGTVLFHVFFFMTTNFVTVNHPYNTTEEITEVGLEDESIEMDEDMMKMLEILNQQNQLNNEPLYNLAADQNDTRDRSYENYSTQEIDQQVANDAKNLEQQYFDEWAKTHPSDDGSSASLQENTEDDKNNESIEPNTNVNELGGEGSNAFAGRVMVSFNLKGRDAHSLQIPGYTCNGSGTVVINIKVDKNGEVKSTEFNSSASRGATECMINKSKKYAKRARFSYDGTASGLASGTITYEFKGQ